jgi:hypothetical protein
MLIESPGARSQGVPSELNSPKMASAGPAHHDEDEDYRKERDDSDAGSRGPSDDKRGGTPVMLPDAAMGPDGTPDMSTPSDFQEEMLPRDVLEKTAYYDYAAEKQLSQEDAKLFYQRSKLEAQKTGGSNWGTTTQTSPLGSPVIPPRNLSNVVDSESTGMRRTGSMASLHSGRNAIPGSVVAFLLVRTYELTAIVTDDIRLLHLLAWLTWESLPRATLYKSQMPEQFFQTTTAYPIIEENLSFLPTKPLEIMLFTLTFRMSTSRCLQWKGYMEQAPALVLGLGVLWTVTPMSHPS